MCLHCILFSISGTISRELESGFGGAHSPLPPHTFYLCLFIALWIIISFAGLPVASLYLHFITVQLLFIIGGPAPFPFLCWGGRAPPGGLLVQALQAIGARWRLDPARTIILGGTAVGSHQLHCVYFVIIYTLRTSLRVAKERKAAPLLQLSVSASALLPSSNNTKLVSPC